MFLVVTLAQPAVRIGTGRVEITQAHRFQAIGTIKIRQHPPTINFDHPYGLIGRCGCDSSSARSLRLCRWPAAVEENKTA